MPGNVDPIELIAALGNSKAEKRASAAKKIRKASILEAGPAVLDALMKEIQDVRTWKSQYEMILALGELHYTDALPFVWELTKYDTPNTTVYLAVGDAIVRLSSTPGGDLKSALDVIATGNDSFICGAFHAMAMLRLIPTTDDQLDLVLQVAEAVLPQEDERYPKDLVGNRLWVAIAAAGWPKEKVGLFLERCLAIPDQGLQMAAAEALKGKYCKWSAW